MLFEEQRQERQRKTGRQQIKESAITDRKKQKLQYPCQYIHHHHVH